jgi:hypothetical protein
VTAGLVLVCDLVALELTRLAPNEGRAREVAERLELFESLPLSERLWRRTRELQLQLAGNGDHRRVPPVDLVLAACAEAAGVPLVHYDRDYERIAAVCSVEQRWLVADGSLA